MRQRLLVLSLFLFFTLAGCGVIGENESKRPIIKAEPSLDSCEFPPYKTLIDKKSVTVELVHSAINCFEAKVNSAFKKIHGKEEGKITLKEIRTLNREKFFTFKNDSYESVWLPFEKVLLPLFDEEGDSAIKLKTIKNLIEIARSNVDLYLRCLHHDWQHEGLPDWIFTEDTYQRAERLIKIISPNFRLSHQQLQNMIDLLEKDFPSSVKGTRVQEGKQQIEAIYVLKSMLLEDVYRQGARADISGRAFLNWSDVAFQVLRKAPRTVQWLRDYGNPNQIPAVLPEEWGAAATIIGSYLTQGSFAAIDQDTMAWAIRTLDSRTPLANLTPDIVRISQRLEGKENLHGGFHPGSLAALLNKGPELARDLITAASTYSGKCSSKSYCSTTTREALKNPVLKHAVLKGELRYHGRSSLEASSNQKFLALDGTFNWDHAVGELVKRIALKTVFGVFEKSGTGEILIDAETETKLKDTVDLSYTFLRFASASPKKEAKPGQKEEVEIPNYVVVNPEKLARVMGLVGDRWMLDGDGNRRMNAEEFYSITQVYLDIQNMTNRFLWNSETVSYFKIDSTLGFTTPQEYVNYTKPIYDRKDFIVNFGKKIEAYSYYYVYDAIQKMEKKRFESLLHALIGNPKLDVVEAYKWDVSQGYSKVSLRNYVEVDAALAPVAVFRMLERLMLKCDTDENSFLSWTEMDCAVPLLVDASYEVVASNLIDLDAPVHDGAKLLLAFLKTPGLPRGIAKLLVANGSIHSFELNNAEAIQNWVQNEMKVSFEQLAYFIGAPKKESDAYLLPYWLAEAKKRFGLCDANQDGVLFQSAELDCFSKAVVREVIRSFSSIADLKLPIESLAQFESLSKSPLFETAIQLATQSEKDINVLFAKLDVKSSPVKILELLEEVVRREKGLQ